MPSPYVALEERARIARDRAVNEVDALLTAKEKRGTDLTADEVTKLDELSEQISTLENDRRLYADLLATRNHRVSVRREPTVYGPGSKFSFFRDVMQARRHDARGLDSQERLRRHAAEQRVEQAVREARGHTEMARLGGSFEIRAEPNITPGQAGYFAPPGFLESPDIVGLYPRPARVLAALSTNLPLPLGVQSLTIPRMSVGTSAGGQVPTAAAPSGDLQDAACVSQIVQFAGISDISLQASEQSPAQALDVAIYRDLCNAIDAAVEVQIISGTGAIGLAGQLPGLLSATVGCISSTFASASPTGALMYSSASQLPGAYASVRRLPPTHFISRTGTWCFVGQGLDSQSRPLDPPADLPAEVNGAAPIGVWYHWPVVLSEAIPTTLGSAANQTAIICARPSDWLIWSSTPVISADDVVLSGTMGIRLLARQYVAFVPHRYGSAAAAVQIGSGMIPSTNY